jgi:hypothetical protein
MLRIAIKSFIRCRFLATTRRQASASIQSVARRYLDLAATLADGEGGCPVKVRSMMGVDEDMREWSVFMLFEHNAIVNRSMTAIVQALARGEEPAGLGTIDPKTGVMPHAAAGSEQIALFRDSVEAHLAAVDGMPRLRGTRAKRHPIFGNLDAHGWHCMFGLHLEVHWPQAREIVSLLRR